MLCLVLWPHWCTRNRVASLIHQKQDREWQAGVVYRSYLISCNSMTYASHTLYKRYFKGYNSRKRWEEEKMYIRELAAISFIQRKKYVPKIALFVQLPNPSSATTFFQVLFLPFQLGCISHPHRFHWQVIYQAGTSSCLQWQNVPCSRVLYGEHTDIPLMLQGHQTDKICSCIELDMEVECFNF